MWSCEATPASSSRFPTFLPISSSAKCSDTCVQCVSRSNILTNSWCRLVFEQFGVHSMLTKRTWACIIRLHQLLTHIPWLYTNSHTAAESLESVLYFYIKNNVFKITYQECENSLIWTNVLTGVARVHNAMLQTKHTENLNTINNLKDICTGLM